MTYSPSYPENTPPPDTGINNVRTNFSSYAGIFDNNHVALNANNQGKHTHVILQSQGSDPSVEGSFDTLYVKSVIATSGTFQELFAKIPSFVPLKPNDPMQLTFNVVNTSGVPYYQSFLPGGYIVFFGTIPSAVTINVPIVLVPAPSKILCVIPNPTKFGGVGLTAKPVEMSVTINSNSQFTINSSFPGGTGDIKWLAICKQ